MAPSKEDSLCDGKLNHKNGGEHGNHSNDTTAQFVNHHNNLNNNHVVHITVEEGDNEKDEPKQLLMKKDRSKENGYANGALPTGCMARPRIEYVRTFVAFLVLTMGTFINFLILTVIHDVVPREPLPDLAFMIIPQQPWAWPLADALSAASVILTFTCLVLHKERWIAARRAFLLTGLVYGLRGVVLMVTFLPPSFSNHDAVCLPKANRTHLETIVHRLPRYFATMGLTSNEERILCGDMMFSGHTISLTLAYFFVTRYSPKKLVKYGLKWVMLVVCYFGMVCMVISGGHYTMDVLISYWLTSHVFWAYHQIFECPKSQRHNAPLTHIWWYYVSVWFETNAPEGPLPTEWSWPLPWPHTLIVATQKISKTLN